MLRLWKKRILNSLKFPSDDIEELLNIKEDSAEAPYLNTLFINNIYNETNQTSPTPFRAKYEDIEIPLSPESKSAAVTFQWWAYILMVLAMFLVCLLLNYIVKKINEARLEERLSRRLGKKSPSEHTPPSRYRMPVTNPKTTDKKIDSEQAISMIFTKEDNQRDISHMEPNIGNGIKHLNGPKKASMSPNHNIAQNINKGIKLVSSDSFKNKVPITSKDTNRSIDSKPIHSICSIININSNVKQSPIDNEVYSVIEEKTEIVTTNSSTEKSAVNAFKAKLLLRTSDDVKSTSDSSAKDSKNDLNQSIEIDETPSIGKVFDKFLGTIYNTTNKDKKDNKYSAETDSYNSHITLVGSQTPSNDTLNSESVHYSEGKIAIINDANSIGLENKTDTPTDNKNIDIDYEKDALKLEVLKIDSYSNAQKTDVSKASTNSEIESVNSNHNEGNTIFIEDPSYCKEESIRITSPSKAMFDLPTKMTKLVESINTFFGGMIRSNTNIINNPSTDGNATCKEMNMENQILLDKLILSEDAINKENNEPLVITYNPGEESCTESEILFLDGNTSSTNPEIGIKSSNDIGASQELLGNNILRKPRDLSAVLSDTRPKGFLNNLLRSSADSVRRIVSDKIINYSDIEMENATKELNRSVISTPNYSSESQLEEIVELQSPAGEKEIQSDKD